MQLTFWISAFIIFYTFLGYGLIITLLARFKKKESKISFHEQELPQITFLVAAYNEEDIIEEKIHNCLNLNYPKEKVKYSFVTDGSDDATMNIIKKYPELELYHKPKREGKISAVNRVMKRIKTPITVFSDANVMINKEGLVNLVKKFNEKNVAAVSGEKVVQAKQIDGASASGEGFYWKYESYLKKKDAEWNSLVGSAGEFFGIRTKHYTEVDKDTLIEDFVITMNLAARGFKVDYAPNALATETGSLNIKEETKRKVRISAGGIQAVIKLSHLLNPFKFGKLTFQYISHRVLRWTLMPIALVAILIANGFIINQGWIYKMALVGQAIFYGLAAVGYLIRNKETNFKLAYIPYYFTYMHYCVGLGWIKYFKGKQQVTWEKSKRAHNLTTTG